MRLILVSLLFLAGCIESSIDSAILTVKSPEFQVGDCFAQVTEENEFPETQDYSAISYRKVLKVGKKKYLYEFDDPRLIGERDIVGTDMFHDKVKCPPGV